MHVQLPYMKGHGGKTWVSMIGASQESQGAQDPSTWPVIIYHALRYVVRPYTHMLRIQLSLLREKEWNLSEPGSPLTQRVEVQGQSSPYRQGVTRADDHSALEAPG